MPLENLRLGDRPYPYERFTAWWVLRKASGLRLIRFPRHQSCGIRLGLSIIIRIGLEASVHSLPAFERTRIDYTFPGKECRAEAYYHGCTYGGQWWVREVTKFPNVSMTE